MGLYESIRVGVIDGSIDGVTRIVSFESIQLVFDSFDGAQMLHSY